MIWSDECSMENSRYSRQILVFREPGERWDSDCIHPKEKNKGIALMI